MAQWNGRQALHTFAKLPATFSSFSLAAARF